MTKPLKIYTVMAPNHHASIYYRIDVILRAMLDLGIPIEVYRDTFSTDVSQEDRMGMVFGSDISLTYQPVGKGFLDVINRGKDFTPWKNDEGHFEWPVSFVADTDDNLFNVHPANPAFRDLGIRSPSGHPLKEGDELVIIDSVGEHHMLWRDGVNGFDISRNLDRLETYRKILKAADAVTCSTPRTEKYVQDESGQTNTFVVPNCVRFDQYDDLRIAPHPDEVWVMWQGSPTHYEDLYPLRSAIGHLSRKYPQLRWIIWGAMYPFVMELVPSHQIKHYKWCPYAEYKIRLSAMNHDINIAPLADNSFASCRSAIKWYESAALPRPVPTVAQNTGAYHDEIIDGETGLLFDDPQGFIDQVSRLIEDVAERKRIAFNAKDWLNENRDAFKVAPKVYEYYLQLRERKRKEIPQPTEEQWKALQDEMKANQAELEKSRSKDGTLHPVHEDAYNGEDRGSSIIGL